MKFTENFMDLPIVVFITEHESYDTSIKILPKDIYSWRMVKANHDKRDILLVKVSGQEFCVNLTIKEFEELVNNFVGDPVTDAEKTIALQQRLFDKINEQL